jgi:ParB-like chromosome segregation protein Spo0J
MKKPERQIEMRKVSDLIPFARNARKHSDAQIAQVAASIREFGWTNPVLIDGENGIIAGHARVEAARKLGLDEVPCIELAGLSKAQKKAYILTDNQLALNASWDNDLLKLELTELKELDFDLELTGFAPEEMAEALYGPSFSPATEEEQGRLDQKKPIKCPSCGHEFTT